ncbi:unnamed protein product [Effrenium voratum]|nr:unnamed protein product [Effrenium voratum]|mmetsp:Transcript_40068/g.95711  ORF Transcript_40068/g.95711 Transcript_40068/m.95711 type:complete len:125 (-) Transcript_40068:136-510(-)
MAVLALISLLAWTATATVVPTKGSEALGLDELDMTEGAESNVTALLAEGGCNDGNWQCHGWAQLGYCQSNAAYMNSVCKRSCNRCSTGPGTGRCRGLNEPCFVNAQCCSARCHPNTFHCRPVGR